MSVQFQQFRIGNFILLTSNGEKKVATFYGLHQSSIPQNVTFKIAKNGLALSSYLSGSIQLSIKWLLKFGFEKSKRHSNLFEKTVSLDKYFPIWKMKDGFYIKISETQTLKIPFVHTLQNYYFESTKTKLEIT
jgi:hypothetical protein